MVSELPTHRTAAACAIAELAIREHCVEIAALREQLQVVLDERDTWRMFTQEALTRVYELTRDLERERLDRYRLLDEMRRLRASELALEAA